MKVIAYKVGQEPQVIELENDLKEMQDFVGGYIEAIPVTDELILVCNEEGKYLDLPTNRQVYMMDRPVLRDVICGNFFVCRDNEEDFADIHDGDIESLGGIIV